MLVCRCCALVYIDYVQGSRSILHLLYWLILVKPIISVRTSFRHRFHEQDPASMQSVSTSETQPLVSLITRSRSVRRKLATYGKCLPLECAWLLSKPVLAIIFINAVIRASYTTIIMATVDGGYPGEDFSITIIGVYLSVAVVTLFYPLSGFLADVCCGRYRVILTSICLLFAGSLIFSLIAAIKIILESTNWIVRSDVRIMTPIGYTLSAIAALLFMSGLAGYQANFIQFGLDQLLEAPSISLALFIHWIIWANSLGTFAIQILDAIFLCKHWSKYSYIVPCSLILILTVFFFLIILCLRWCKFYAEPQKDNPYKMIFRVLNFARKHKFPLGRSAFTYCDDETPSRVDFAKERYGGPFTTEQVEDVKTFLKVLLVLVFIGPAFVLEVPTSLFVTIMFGVHTGEYSAIMHQACTGEFVLLEEGSVNNLVAVILLPLIMWVTFFTLQRRVVKIFSRLRFAVVVYLLGVASMLCIDLAGHIAVRENTTGNSSSMCMFVVEHRFEQPLLRLHWAVLLIPGVLLGIGPPLVIATTFEFISAQSPSSMKGLLVGVFFTIRAMFQLISGVALVPFAYRSLWNRQHMIEHPPVTNCGFGYLLFTCVVALIGLVLLSVVAKRYKYRERDDRPYDQRFAVDVYGRYIEQALENNVN